MAKESLSERDFQAIFEAAAVGTALTDMEGRLIETNRALQRFLGYSAEELVGMAFPDFTYPDDAAVQIELFQELIEGKRESYRLEKRYIRRDGAIVWGRLTESLLRDAEGQPRYAIAIVEDIGDFKRVEEEQRFLSEASVALASSLDYDATLNTVAHLAVPDIADWCVVDVLGSENQLRRIVAAHVDPAKVDLAKRVNERYPTRLEAGGPGQVLRSGKSLLVEEITREQLVAGAVDDEHRRILLQMGIYSAMIVPMIARGAALGTITFVSAESNRRYTSRDVRLAEELALRAALAIDNANLFEAEQRARGEAELLYEAEREARSTAQEALRTRDNFLSIASHELKTPLTALQLQIQMLERLQRRAGDGGERSQSIIASSHRQIKRLSRLVDDLLDVSRISAGRLVLNRETTDAREVINDVAARFEEEIRNAGCTLKLEVKGSVIGDWDRFRLDQVITNLLSNAIKYGAGEPIDVSLVEQKGTVVLTVRDRGFGIRPEDAERIFDRFERLVPSRNYGGLGLGLHIAREIVLAHGGTITAEGEPGTGATFTVTLPRDRGPDEATTVLSG